MKNKKVLIGTIVGIVVVAVIIVAVIGLGKDENNTEPTTEITTEEAVIDIPTDIEDDTTEPETLVEDDDMLKIEDVDTVTEKPNTNENAVKVDKPVVENENRNDNAQGIVINGDADTNIYSCGKSGHHCESKETHDFIVSLENKGCPHCGSHSCKSFYTTDEWGNACYDETKCPQYNVKKDPLKYCQDCGKPIGKGDNGTCVHFTVDTKCPDCNEPVKARTCHSH